MTEQNCTRLACVVAAAHCCLLCRPFPLLRLLFLLRFGFASRAFSASSTFLSFSLSGLFLRALRGAFLFLLGAVLLCRVAFVKLARFVSPASAKPNSIRRRIARACLGALIGAANAHLRTSQPAVESWPKLRKANFVLSSRQLGPPLRLQGA